MKKVSIIFFLSLMMISTVAFCVVVDKPSSGYGIAVMKKGSVFMLHYKSESLQNVSVIIYDNVNHPVFSETLRKTDNFIRPYNMSALQEGEYTITVEDNNGKQVERINYVAGKVEKLAGVVKLTGEDNKYVLSVSNKGNDVLTVNIYDGSNSLVYTEKNEVTGDFAKIYNLSKVKGAYTFVVTDASGSSKAIQY